MAHDYRGFQDKMHSDMTAASATAASMDQRGKGSKVRIRTSDMEGLIPSGSSVEFIPIACHKLKFGDIVFVRNNKEFVLRRFVSFNLNKAGGAMVALARIKPPALEQYQDSLLVGRVTSVESQGKVFDPHKKESFGQRMSNEWTCFGTSSPLKRLVSGLRSFGKMMKITKKKK